MTSDPDADRTSPAGYGCQMTVSWSEEIDGVLGGDLTAALTYLTPAGGAVATAVAPVGLRDRQAGWVGFTTSLGFGKKLDRIQRDPHVALAFHARQYGTSHSQRYVLVQGRAEIVPDPDEALRTLVWDQAVGVLGPAKRGRLFWDRWLRQYYAVRVPVLVQVDRILTWPDLRCEGSPEVLGTPAPLGPPAPQDPPKRGTGPRLNSARAARRCRAKRHQLLVYRGADAYPVTVPVQVKDGGPGGMRLTAVPGLLPPGGRRAGLLAHSYRAAADRAGDPLPHRLARGRPRGDRDLRAAYRRRVRGPAQQDAPAAGERPGRQAGGPLGPQGWPTDRAAGRHVPHA